MNVFFRSFDVKIVILIVFAFVRCLHFENDNPIDPLYSDSNYFLKVKWQFLPNPCKTNTEYLIPCSTSIGKNAFSQFYFYEGGDSVEVQTGAAHDTIKLIFRKEFNGRPVILGIRPNGKNIKDTCKNVIVAIDQPIVIFQDTTKIARSQGNIVITITDSCSDSIKIFWKMLNDSTIYSKTPDHFDTSVTCTLNAPIIVSNDTMMVWAWNSFNRISDTLKILVSVDSYLPMLENIIVPDTLPYNETLRFKVNSKRFASSFQVKIWSKNSYNSQVSQLYPYDSSIDVEVQIRRDILSHDTGKVPLYVALIDSSGTKSTNVISDSIYIDPMYPVMFAEKSYYLPLISDSQYINTYDISNHATQYIAKTYLWILGKDTNTTKVPFFKKIFSSSKTDTLKIIGVNQFGFSSTPIISIISVRKYTYALLTNDSLFPVIIAAHSTTPFMVEVDNAYDFQFKHGIFHWRIDSSDVKIVEDSGEGRSSFNSPLNAGIYTVSVLAKDMNNDSSNWIKKTILVLPFAPQFTFYRSVDTLFSENPEDTLRIHYWDDYGYVEFVFWDIKSNGQLEYRKNGIQKDSILIINNTDIVAKNPGIHTVYVYVKNSNGFVSSTDSMLIIVNSKGPFKSKNIADMYVLKDSTATMRALFQPGSYNSPIIKYFWQINGFLQAESTDVLSKKFGIIHCDTIAVYCQDQNSRRSNSDTFFVNVVGDKKPIVNQFAPDSVWMGNNTTYTITATTVTPVPVVNYFVAWNVTTTVLPDFKQYSSPIISYNYPDSGAHAIKVFVVDSESQSSDTQSYSVFVRQGKPVIDGVVINGKKVDTTLADIYVRQTQPLTVFSHDTNGQIDLIKIMRTNKTTSIDTSNYKSSEIAYQFPKESSGLNLLTVIVKDNSGLWSAPFNCSLNIKYGKPVVTSITSDSSIIIKDKKRRFTISAQDSANASIDSIFVSFDNGASFFLKKSVFDTVFNSWGNKIAIVYVKDHRNLPSDCLKDTFLVNDPGLSITSVDMKIDNLSENTVFALDSHTFVFTGIDTAVKIDTIKIAWDGSEKFTHIAKADTNNSVIFGHKFSVSDSAIKKIRVYLSNTHFQSTEMDVSINIRLGRPVVDSITPKVIWVNDDTLFKIATHDTNGAVAGIIIDWKDGNRDTVLTAGHDTVSKSHTFSIAHNGRIPVTITAIDTDGLFSAPTLCTLTVRQGKPTVIVDSIFPTTVYVNDDTIFSIPTNDTNSINGAVDSLFIDWGDLTGQTKWARSDIIKHKYSITQKAGMKIIKILVLDNDSVRSDTCYAQITLNRGEPHMLPVKDNETMLWIHSSKVPPDTLDTLVCPYGTDNITTITVDDTDYNGKVGLISWVVNNNFLVKNDTSRTWRIASSLTRDSTYLFKVRCQDDDSLWSDTFKFYVLPHSPPWQTTGMNFQQGRLFWNGDDIPTTQYKVILKKTGSDSIMASDELPGGCSAPQCYSIDFKLGSQYDNGKYFGITTIDYSLLVSQIAPSGSYWYKIYLKNSRGQITRCFGTPSF
jgi:hypothetical protein